MKSKCARDAHQEERQDLLFNRQTYFLASFQNESLFTSNCVEGPTLNSKTFCLDLCRALFALGFGNVSLSCFQLPVAEWRLRRGIMAVL